MSTTCNYPIQMVQEARTMRAGGWSCPAIHRHFEQAGGPVPSLFTIYSWTDERRSKLANKAARDFNARKSADNATFALRSNQPEYREAFMQRLRDEGVPPASIAKVLRVVGQPMDAKTVKRRLDKRKAAAA